MPPKDLGLGDQVLDRDSLAHGCQRQTGAETPQVFMCITHKFSAQNQQVVLVWR